MATGNKAGEALALPADHFQKELARLIADSRAFALGDDVDSISILLSNWLPDFRALIEDSLSVLNDLESIAELARSDRGGVREGWSRSTGTLILPRAFEELADLCFVAAAECRACQREVEPLSAESEPFTLLVVMERSQSRLSGSLCAVEARLAQMSGQLSTTRHVDLGRKSLRARALIARFRRRVASVIHQAEDSMGQRLRSCGNSFAWLLGHDHFSSLRASDRLTAKLLHRRILDWLRTGDLQEDDGRHLWQDVSAFVQLQKLINNRPEIVQHDAKVVLQVMSILADSDPHGPLPCSVIERLHAISGRDEVLDDLLVTQADTAQVLSQLFEVYAALERQGVKMDPPSPVGGPGDFRPGPTPKATRFRQSTSRPQGSRNSETARKAGATNEQQRGRAGGGLRAVAM